MIKIIVQSSGNALDLYPDFSISFELKSPVFSDKAGEGSHSFPFRLPATGPNRKELGYREYRDNSVTASTDVTVDVLLEDVFWKTFKLAVRQVSTKEYEGDLRTDAGLVAKAWKNKRLRDIGLGGERKLVPATKVNAIAYMKTVAMSDVDSYDYTFFPVKNPDFWSGKFMDVSSWPGDLYQGYINWYYESTFLEGHFKPYVFPSSPFPYLTYVCSQVFADQDFTVGGTWMNDSEIKTLAILNNYRWFWTYDLKNHVPDISVGDFLFGLKELFCLAYIYDSQNLNVDVTPLKDIVTSEDFVDFTDRTSPLYTLGENEYEGREYLYVHDDADENADTKFRSLEDYNVLSSVASFSALLTLSATSSEGDVRLVENLGHYYIAAIDTSSGSLVWQYLADNLQPYTDGDGKKKIDPGISTPSNIRENDTDVTSWQGLDLRGWKIPEMKIDGSAKPFRIDPAGPAFYHDQGTNPMAFHLAFYRGMHPDTRGFDYPFASYDVEDNDFNKVGNYSLERDTDEGLYNVWWKDWLTFIANTRPVRYKKRMTVTELTSLDFTKYHRVDGVDHLIESVRLTVRSTGMQPAVINGKTRPPS